MEPGRFFFFWIRPTWLVESTETEAEPLPRVRTGIEGPKTRTTGRKCAEVSTETWQWSNQPTHCSLPKEGKGIIKVAKARPMSPLWIRRR
jgi:hypothetical protein